MEPNRTIDGFLQRVHKKRTRVLTLKGLYLLFAFLTGGFLLGNLFSYYFPVQVQEFWLPLAIFFGGAFAYLLFYCFLREGATAFTLDQAALLTEKKFPDLDNSLINARQLSRRLSPPQSDEDISLAFIQEQLRRTQSLITKIPPESIIDSREETRHRNGFLGVLALLGIVAFLLPDFFSTGFKNLVSPPSPAASQIQTRAAKPVEMPAAASGKFAILDLKLTFNYPAYTGMSSQVIHPSDGKIKVLPGTEVQVQGTVNLPVAGGELVWNAKDNFTMQVLKNNVLATGFLVKDQGSYQFRVKDAEGIKHLLPEKYAVTVTRDRAPTIVLFIANPKPVYYANGKIELFYEARDEFGISEIDLVAFVNDKPFRQSVKRVKNGDRDLQGSHSWPLGEMALNPGDNVEYFLEIKDNDNVRGPNIGQSETFSFTIFDSREEQENLIALQEELTEKLIVQLASGLIVGAESKAKPIDAMNWKSHLIASADALIEIIGLAQIIEERAKTLEFFPRPYFNLLKNIIKGLNQIRDEQISAINQIQTTVLKPTPVAYGTLDLNGLNRRLVSQLETNILFLVKMTNRQKLDQVMDLEKHLNELTESLSEEFEKIRDKKAPLKPNELKRKIDQIRQTLEKIMDQLARQTQSMPDEFLNPESFKGMKMDELSASLDRMMDLLNRGKIDEAMEELQKMVEDLQTLANQLDQAESDMDDLMDMKAMQQLDDSLEKLQQLEKDQKKLLDETTKINQSLRKAQSKLFEDAIRKVFAEIKKYLNEIQSILKENDQYLNEHPTMKALNKLLDEEMKVNQKLQALSQRTVDATQGPELESNFKKLNAAKMERAQLLTEMDFLRANIFQRFKNFLPQLQEKYDTLEEFTELQDLNEFNNLFKNTYPAVFQWLNNIRTTPNKRQDLGARLNEDLKQVTRLNTEISKKLGSMMRTIKESEQALLSEENKAKMQEMAQEEQRMKKESEQMTQRFEQMNKENPMFTPELANKMSRTGRNMQRAQSNLKQNQVQRSIRAENQALKQLQETQEMIKEIKESSSEQGQQGSRSSTLKFGTGQSKDARRGGSMRMQKEKVHLPSEDQYKVPGEFREEILRAMKNHTPKDYQRMVMEYYKELVK